MKIHRNHTLNEKKKGEFYVRIRLKKLRKATQKI